MVILFLFFTLNDMGGNWSLEYALISLHVATRTSQYCTDLEVVISLFVFSVHYSHNHSYLSIE
jgi:hypothetical protein